uniref:Nuclear transport factor 2 family protein n=1 Tax=Haemonchus placei TaxID=6290 RepID=A0A0N4VZY3_HAEPC
LRTGHMGGRKMWMWFHTQVNDTLLFKDWWIQDAETLTKIPRI